MDLWELMTHIRVIGLTGFIVQYVHLFSLWKYLFLFYEHGYKVASRFQLSWHPSPYVCIQNNPGPDIAALVVTFYPPNASRVVPTLFLSPRVERWVTEDRVVQQQSLTLCTHTCMGHKGLRSVLWVQRFKGAHAVQRLCTCDYIIQIHAAIPYDVYVTSSFCELIEQHL